MPGRLKDEVTHILPGGLPVGVLSEIYQPKSILITDHLTSRSSKLFSQSVPSLDLLRFEGYLHFFRTRPQITKATQCKKTRR